MSQLLEDEMNEELVVDVPAAQTPLNWDNPAPAPDPSGRFVDAGAVGAGVGQQQQRPSRPDAQVAAKFSAVELVTGQPVEATWGIMSLMGLQDAAAAAFLTGKEKMVAAEFSGAGVSAEHRDNFRRVSQGLAFAGHPATAQPLDALLQHDDAITAVS
eukprot:COSAG06_NODE_16384_length_1004_cov_0.948066_1_plen_157_part_00